MSTANIRSDGIGAKAILEPRELTDLQQLRRWGFQGILHYPRCDRV